MKKRKKNEMKTTTFVSDNGLAFWIIFGIFFNYIWTMYLIFNFLDSDTLDTFQICFNSESFRSKYH